MRLALAVPVCLLLAAAPAAASPAPVKRPPVQWVKGEGNYTKAHRGPKAIRRIVVHVTQGAFWPSVAWLRSEQSHASSHYVVSRRGRILQLVHESDIAWHAGNWRTNVESVGIEHEGFVDDPAGFTDAQYESSARLAAFIARRAVMPIDRRHLIGHDEVPHPSDPRLAGGADGHTDPGPSWDWKRYLKLVRTYAFPKRPKPVRLRIAASNLSPGQVVRGQVPWRARTSGPVRRVEVRIDGKLALRDRSAPFGGRWDTRRVANGRHVVELRAYGPGGAWTRKRIRVRVANPALRLRLGPVPAEVTGVVPVTATPAGGAVRTVLLFLDGKRIDHDTSAPYGFAWDTRRAANGRHALEVVVRARDGREARRRVVVAVANPRVRAQSPLEGQTVSSPLAWTVETAGRVARVEFVVDGTVRWTADAAPFAWTWDPAGDAPGPHVLTARAVAPDGTAAEAAVTVVVP